MVRRMLSKRALVGLVAATLCLAILYVYQTSTTTSAAYLEAGGRSIIHSFLPTKPAAAGPLAPRAKDAPPAAPSSADPGLIYSSPDEGGVCLASDAVKTDIDTTEVLPTLNFDAPWMSAREYWSDFLEKRYLMTRRSVWKKKPLEVVIMPHSHNDPGWLKTLEGYYNKDTKEILNNAVDQMSKYKNMTFVWTEMQFLAMWWSEAHPVRQRNLKQLIKEGRFEVLTGGWVMTDEANVNLFAMVDQLVEGHSWIRSTLGKEAIPKSSWSVDPFGHGGTFPYVLKASGVDNMVIMRIHYAWKEYFAKHRSGDFLWTQRWSKKTGEGGKSNSGQILCHNFPYDIYSVKGSCGPKADVCLQFNFAAKAVQQSYNEYAMATRPITPGNVKERAELLLESYGRTGSLHDHNVVLVPLGDDFTYVKSVEWDEQYSNYKALIDHINSHPEYNAHVRFGTLSDYFDMVRKRTSSFPSLNGDFYVYSDIFSSGYPAYWSGYFTTRPFMKQLSRHVEASLRSAEILFSLTHPRHPALTDDYASKLAVARQNLALFQHHDAITGTAKEHVMYDYGKKMFKGLQRTQSLQQKCLEILMGMDPGTLWADTYRTNYQDLPLPVPLNVASGDRVIVAFNSLANDVVNDVTFTVEDSRTASDLCIVDVDDESKATLPYQVSVSAQVSSTGTVEKSVQVVFMAHLPALSAKTFRVFQCQDEAGFQASNPVQKTQIYCLNECKYTSSRLEKVMTVHKLPDQIAQIESHRYLLTFDPETWLLTKVKDKKSGKEHHIDVEIFAYPTQAHSSGAYLFAVDEFRDGAFLDSVQDVTQVIIISGTVYTELQVHYEGGISSPKTSLVHTVRLYHSKRSSLSRGIYVENYLDLGDVSNFRDTDVVMRLTAKGLANGGTFYTDQNGFQMQRRQLMSNLGVRANIYPVTNMAYIEDRSTRMSLVVDHAAAATSLSEGSLEVVMDRRAAYDDGRGLGEGVTDNQDTVHKYWLLLEEEASPAAAAATSVSTPTKLATFLNRRLNYPVSTFHGRGAPSLRLMSRGLSCDTHLFNLRTMSAGDNHLKPAESALLMLHSQHSEECGDKQPEYLECDYSEGVGGPPDQPVFEGLDMSSVVRTTLTGSPLAADDQNSQSTGLFKPDPMTIETFKIDLKPSK